MKKLIAKKNLLLVALTLLVAWVVISFFYCLLDGAYCHPFSGTVYFILMLPGNLLVSLM